MGEIFAGLLGSFCMLGVAQAASFEYGLNDLSVLLPLPFDQSEYNLMLSPTSTGPLGELLPAELVKQLPALLVGPSSKSKAEVSGSLRLLALRFDPCFREGNEACRHQIRLVFQPLDPFRNGYISTDAAVHAFYEFNDAQWKEVVKDWRTTAVGKKTEPLDVHPIIAREGLSGNHWSKIKALVQKHCGVKGLTRVTMSNVHSLGQLWAFIFFEVKEEGTMLVPHRISRIKTAWQVFRGDLGDMREFFGDVRPPPPPEDAMLLRIWQHSIGVKSTVREEEIQAGVERAIAFENPKKFNTENLDCVSCHLAGQTRIWGKENFRNWNWESMFARNGYTNSGWNISNKTPEALLTNRVRAFGYFTDMPVITQRVINETAEVADAMAKELAGI